MNDHKYWTTLIPQAEAAKSQTRILLQATPVPGKDTGHSD